jgi:hypothetical protein
MAETKSKSGSDSGTTAKSTKTPVTVKFTGPSVVTRRMTVADWKRAGLDEEQAKAVGDVEWNLGNEHTVDAGEWPDETFDILKKDRDFKVSGRESTSGS